MFAVKIILVFQQCFCLNVTDKLTSNFTIYGLCQLSANYTDAPGKALYDEIKTWKASTPGYSWSWVTDNSIITRILSILIIFV